MISSQNLFKKLLLKKKKVKNATSLRVGWRKYCCFNPNGSSFNNNNTIKKWNQVVH